MNLAAPAHTDSTLLDQFCDNLWLEDGLAKNTLAAYRSDLALFAGWLTHQGGTLEAVDGQRIKDYLAYLHHRPPAQQPKPASQRRLHRALRRFLHLPAGPSRGTGFRFLVTSTTPPISTISTM
mgnify:CR=1 FL=1